jgi:hypothetical protein
MKHWYYERSFLGGPWKGPLPFTDYQADTLNRGKDAEALNEEDCRELVRQWNACGYNGWYRYRLVE